MMIFGGGGGLVLTSSIRALVPVFSEGKAKDCISDDGEAFVAAGWYGSKVTVESDASAL